MTKFYLAKESEMGVKFLLRESENAGLVPVFCNRQNGHLCGNHCEAFSYAPSGGVYCALTNGQAFHILEDETPDMPKPKPQPNPNQPLIKMPTSKIPTNKE